MRPFTIAFAIALSCLSLAQKRDGIYTPTVGTPAKWEINDHHALIWDSNPYLPIGVRAEPNVATLDAIKAAGIKDVLFDLPVSGAGWTHAIELAEARGLNYTIRISSTAPQAQGIVVDPSAYRVSTIKGPKHIDVALPNIERGLLVLAQRRDGVVLKSSRFTTKDGRLTYDISVPSDMETVVLIYPERSSLQQIDYWDGMDKHRDQLLNSLRKSGLGKGFRGLVNPMGSLLSLPGSELRFVPTSQSFRTELRNVLEEKHKAYETVIKAWSLRSSNLTSEKAEDTTAGAKRTRTSTFDDLSRLVPLWSGTRGISQLWDPETDQLYTCDKAKSRIWADYSDAINEACLRRYTRLIASIRSVTDVPVVQEWSGWALPYESAKPALDGVSMKVTGTTPHAILQGAARAASTVMRWRDKGLLLATDVQLGDTKTAVSQLAATIDDLQNVGARGIFFRTDDPSLIKAIGAEAKTRSADTTIAQSSPEAIFFPENATNPATAQRLTNGKWWLPSPAPGNRVDLGRNFFAYRIREHGDRLVLWARYPGRVVLRLTNKQSATFQTLDGSDPGVKIVKNGVELKLTQIPMIVGGTDEIPVPDPAFQEVVMGFSEMLRAADASHKEVTKERITFSDAFGGFERNPGGSFTVMREQYVRLSQKVGDTTWVEAESSTDNNMSEVVEMPGCSGGSNLSLAPMVESESGFYANYTIPVKSPDDQEVWVALKISPEMRKNFSLQVGGQVLTIQSEGIESYGDGFAWYQLGKTRIGGASTKVRLQIVNAVGSEMAIDTIVFSPKPFKPSGVQPPEVPNLPVPLAVGKG